MTVKEWKRKNPPIQRKPITNADRIRAMSDEELAEFIRNIMMHGCSAIGDLDCLSYRSCAECLFKWLNSEVEK